MSDFKKAVFWLAAIGSTAAARRTALAHTLSNVIGSLVFLPFVLPVFVPAVKAIFPAWDAVSETAKGPVLLGVMAPIAAADTAFSVLRGLLFLPLAGPFVRLVERLVPQGEDEKPHLSALRTGAISPVVACDLAFVEVQFMRDSNIELFACARKIIAGEADDATERHLLHREQILDNVQGETTAYLANVMKKRLPADVAARARRLLRLADELESASDETARIQKAVARLRREGQKMSAASVALLLRLHDRTVSFVSGVSALVRSPRPPVDVEAFRAESKGLHSFVRDCLRAQVGRIGPDDSGSPLRVLGELDIVNAYDRARSCYLNVAETLADVK